MRLPPGVSSAAFAAALKEFEGAVGSEWVFTSDEDVNLYRDSYSLLARRRRPRSVRGGRARQRGTSAGSRQSGE